MGNPVSDEQIWQTLSLCEADGFIAEKPAKLDTILGGNTSRLSGGEQQRIAIARALIKDANVYFLDEATSFFDPQIELTLLTRLLQELKQQTLLFVTHRLSMAQKADKIIVMETGKVMGFAPHQELLLHCQEYRQLLLIQDTFTQVQESITKEAYFA